MSSEDIKRYPNVIFSKDAQAVLEQAIEYAKKRGLYKSLIGLANFQHRYLDAHPGSKVYVYKAMGEMSFYAQLFVNDKKYLSAGLKYVKTKDFDGWVAEQTTPAEKVE